MNINTPCHQTVTTKTPRKKKMEKDLGVNIDVQLTFSKHIEIQVNKANKILGMIRRSYEFLDGGLPQNIMYNSYTPTS